MTRSITALVMLAMAAPATLLAQTENHPTGWHWRLDNDARRVSTQAVTDTTWRFDTMAPGWHLTTGPAGLFYPTGEQASGNFSLAADFVIFPGTTDAGFGIFLGGRKLDGNTPAYVAALLRRDGSAAIVHHDSGKQTMLAPWTKHASIKPYEGRGVITNRMRVNVSADSMRVFVNDSSVLRIPLANTDASGHFGFKVGERVNLHLTILDHTRHLAPARSK